MKRRPVGALLDAVAAQQIREDAELRTYLVDPGTSRHTPVDVDPLYAASFAEPGSWDDTGWRLVVLTAEGEAARATATDGVQ